MNHYCLVMESAGIGDIVCAGAVARSLKAADAGASVMAAGFPELGNVWLKMEGIDDFIPLLIDPAKVRLPGYPFDEELWPYLSPLSGLGMKIIDLNHCVGCVEDRIALMCASVGLTEDRILPPRWLVTHENREDAKTILYGIVKNNLGPLIGLHVHASNPARSYPNDMAMELVNRLRDAGMGVVVLDSEWRGGVDRTCPLLVCPPHCLGATAEQLDLVVCVNSAWAHVAGAVSQRSVWISPATDCRLSSRWYDDVHVVEPYRYREDPVYGCEAPCGLREKDGFSQWCADEGCAWSRRLSPLEIFNTVTELIHAGPEERLVGRLQPRPARVSQSDTHICNQDIRRLSARPGGLRSSSGGGEDKGALLPAVGAVCGLEDA